MHYSKLALVAFAAVAVAHPGEHEEHNELADQAKKAFHAHTRRSLASCADKLERRGLTARAQARRKATVEKLSKRRVVRDTDTVLNTSHHSSLDVTPISNDDVIFTSNSTCVLNPEGETGPYWVKGEHIRSRLREDQEGVPVIIDGQFLDVETCEPIVGLWWDIWNCNATGVYSGLSSSGNGNENDTSNMNTTFLRGIQQTDSDGVVQFDTLVPGHYSGRTNHVHLIANLNATILPNNTLTGGDVAYIGQLFFDQSLIDAVEATYPYNTNTITQTTNAEDRVFSTETTDSTSDPVLEYVMLGDDLSDGLFAWITVAVNTSAAYDPSYSFAYTAEGGVAETGGSD